MSRTSRFGVWAVIIAFAAFQAYANRYAISPDGISYLDLSDAVVRGRWGDLVNLYWSPLYPFLIGVARVIAGAGPEHEVPIVHAVNFVAFLAMCGAFEYFISKVFALRQGIRRPILSGTWGTLAAYALFASLALTMTPLELTTPDSLSNASILAALGALVRLRDDPHDPHDRRAAVTLGAALGIGALAKSFLVPWSLVCFAAGALALRRRARTPLMYAVAAWAVFLVPWTAVLSRQAGRLTFGDAGRLTWAWYVNGENAPSLGLVPPGARTAATDRFLPGVGLTSVAPGTDPMWYDPARWNTALRPRLSVADEISAFRAMSIALIASLSVILYLALAIAVAPPGARREYVARSWIVLVPCALGIAGYLMVLLTARYIMGFVLAAILITLATVPLARRINPTWLLLGLVLSIYPLALSRVTAFGFSFVIAVAMAMLVGALVPTRRHIAWMVLVPLALVFSLLVFSPAAPGLMRLGSVLVIVALWLMAQSAVRRHATRQFARGAQTALAVSIGLITLGRLALRVNRDAAATARAARPESANPQWQIAKDLAAHGISPGTRIAVIGPHAEAYWARTARLTIVGSVPDPLAPVWWMLAPEARDSILAQFANAGADFAIATRAPSRQPIGDGWTPLTFKGWARRLRQGK
ncbi:MAG TPA: hypothetical protein VH277_01260 [Gemmatimonadaceae bacterium]|nr:hypothetical protein [Gemmatimonadaceae bacterium]